jgi:hypothetical protein
MARRSFVLKLDRDTHGLLQELVRLAGATPATVVKQALRGYARQLGLRSMGESSPGRAEALCEINRGRRGWVCPSCHSARVLPLEYGILNPRLSREIEVGKCAYGGRILSDESPELVCVDCGAEFDVPARAGMAMHERFTPR